MNIIEKIDNSLKKENLEYSDYVNPYFINELKNLCEKYNYLSTELEDNFDRLISDYVEM